MAQVSVTIDDKTYRMACEEGQEEHLYALADQLDAHIRDLRGQVGEIGDHRLSLMAGILVLDELSATKRQLAEARADLEDAVRSRDAAIERADGAAGHIGDELGECAARIEAIAGKLNGSVG